MAVACLFIYLFSCNNITKHSQDKSDCECELWCTQTTRKQRNEFREGEKNAKFISINKRQKHAQQIFWLKANHILLFPFFSFRVEEKHSWKRIFLFLFSVVRLLFIELKNICRIKNVVDLHCVESTAKNCTEKLHVNNRFMHGHAYVHGSSIICKLISERAIFLSGCRSMYGNVAFFANDQMPLLQCFVGCQCKQNVRRWQAATTPTWPKKTSNRIFRTDKYTESRKPPEKKWARKLSLKSISHHSENICWSYIKIVVFGDVLCVSVFSVTFL